MVQPGVVVAPSTVRTTVFWHPRNWIRLLLPLLGVIWGPVVAVAVAQAVPAPTALSTAGVAREHNLWARFQPPAWNTARTVTETFDGAGNTIHVTTATVTTTLTEVVGDRYLLRTETSLDIDGKRLRSPPQTASYDLFDRAGPTPRFSRDDAPASVEIDGKPIACRVLRLTATTGQGKEETTIYYAADVAPYLLRRETRTTDLAGKVAIDQTTEMVTHLQLRRRVMGSLLWTSQLKMVRRNSKGSTVTVAYLCEGIPGGIVDRMSTEFDADGRVIRSSTVELIGYGCQTEPIRIFQRSRPRRRFRYPR